MVTVTYPPLITISVCYLISIIIFIYIGKVLIKREKCKNKYLFVDIPTQYKYLLYFGFMIFTIGTLNLIVYIPTIINK